MKNNAVQNKNTISRVYCLSRSFEHIFSKGNFLPLYLPNTLKNENIKNEKIPWRYHHFTQVHQKSWLPAIVFQSYGT